MEVNGTSGDYMWQQHCGGHGKGCLEQLHDGWHGGHGKGCLEQLHDCWHGGHGKGCLEQLHACWHGGHGKGCLEQLHDGWHGEGCLEQLRDGGHGEGCLEQLHDGGHGEGRATPTFWALNGCLTLNICSMDLLSISRLVWLPKVILRFLVSITLALSVLLLKLLLSTAVVTPSTFLTQFSISTTPRLPRYKPS
ncbi:uncharacterized protein LOC111795076 [Cucurbita pepo subsp. pepo]|uniref:uncharacterized protein LOC111795076 n=1 Tax=Cucurbita pepo subsp. pepo TaxID=3664 RepID=UPI000C9D2864|nr:uncharacterized protein LOC111795076 [Cucurbita pepo subsp. pepo]